MAWKEILLVTSVLGGLSVATSAAAQDVGAEKTRPAQSIQLEEVVVTAQKREERLLDVPVSVSAVTAGMLTSQNIVKLSDFYNRVPSVQFSGQRTSNISIRGITSGGNTNPTVAILVDDVPFGGSTNAGQPPLPDFDPGTLERIEVLRGPQGTLYGASSLGGLIKYVTREPSTDQFTAHAETGVNTVEGGSLGYSGRASVNLPVVTDKLAVSLSGFYRNDPRWIDDIHPNYTKENVNSKITWGGRAAALLKPTDDLKISLSALKEKFSTRFSDLSLTNGIPICSACQGSGNTAMTDFSPLYANTSTVRLAPGNIGKSTYQLYTGRIDYDLHWAKFVSISAYGKADNVLQNDLTSVFGGFMIPAYGAATGSTVAINNGDFTHKFSEEARLSGTGSKVDWLVGGFYTRERASTFQTLVLSDPSGSLIDTPYFGDGPATYKEYAAFADLTYHVSDKLAVQVGGRYAKNKQTSTQSLTIADPVEFAFGPSSVISAESKDDAFTWLISPSYHFNPDLMGYVRIASGYRPGGPNTGVTNANPTFGSDSVINYEAGLKGYVVPHVLSLEASIFQIDWKDIQLQNTDAVSQLTFLTNGGRARSRGLELSGRWLPWRGFTVDGNTAFTDAVLTEDLPPQALGSTLSGGKGDRLPFTARFTGSISVQQDFDVTDRVRGFVGGTFSYVGDRQSAFRTSDASATRPRFTIPSYAMVDLRAGVSVDQDWSVTAYVRNLFDEHGVLVATNRNGTSAPTALFVQPRTVGLTLSYTFE